MDYQTAKSADSSYVTYRHYLEDAVFLVGLESSDRSLLQELETALRHPAFPLYLGRRSCPPTLPLCRGIRETPLLETLQNEPVREERIRPTRILLDASPQESRTALQKDVPVSYSPLHRQYAYRSVREVRFTPKPKAPETTQHDPFQEL